MIIIFHHIFLKLPAGADSLSVQAVIPEQEQTAAAPVVLADNNPYVQKRPEQKESPCHYCFLTVPKNLEKQTNKETKKNPAWTDLP